MSLLALVLLLRELRPYLGSGPQRTGRGLRLCLMNFLVVGAGLMTAVATFNYLEPVYALTSALATVGGTSFLSWMYTLDTTGHGEATLGVPAHRGWWVAGGIALVALVIFGRGIQFSP